MKKLIAAVLVSIIVPAYAYAAKTTYIVTNQRFNYVKLKEVSPKVAEARNMTHPYEISEEQIRGILKSIKLSKRHLASKEIDTQEVFNESAISYLAPALARAFREADSNEEIVISYLVKEPYFILRNDRLNIANLWISGNEMHLRFQKLDAKMTGDTDKRGSESKLISNARSLRTDLELGPGQTMAIGDSDQLIIDLNYNFSAAGQQAAAPEQTEPEKAKSKKKSKKDETAQEKSGIAAASPAAEPEPADIKARLERLEELKKEKLITNQEYYEKKKEILKDL
jgi:hypothetical protein